MENQTADNAIEEPIESKGTELVKELHIALYGRSWAAGESPRSVWKMLLNEVTRMRTELETWPRVSADDRAVLEEVALVRRLVDRKRRIGESVHAADRVHNATAMEFREARQDLDTARNRLLRLTNPEE